MLKKWYWRNNGKRKKHIKWGTKMCAKLVLTLIFAGFTSILNGQSDILIDFGTDAGSNIFGVNGWNTLIKSPVVNYSSDGPGGLIPNSGVEEFDDYQGVQGTARNFQPGERIVVTWYNTSPTETFNITARISFEDANAPNEDGADGSWFTMRRFADYRYAYTEIEPNSSIKTVFNITDSGVHKTDGYHSVVNVNVSVEWFDNFPKQYLLCDKIEIFYDADITPPNAPDGLTATTISDSQIELNWNNSSDNIGVVEYLIYRGAEVEAYSRTNSCAIKLLEPSTSYTFSVTALDAAGNESDHSEQVSASTLPSNISADLFDPAGLKYLGAFTLPETFAYGGDALTYNPNGDGGQTASGASNGYPGSLFISNLNIPEEGFCAEVSIPAPIISAGHNIDDLNIGSIIQAPANIRPGNVNDWDYVDIWRSDFDYVPEETRLYSSWGIYYTVTEEKHPSISFCDPNDLSGSLKYGAWYVGESNEQPNDKKLGDYLFHTPQSWADANAFGRALVNGRYREGGLSGLGPTLYAVSLIGGNPTPAPESELPMTTLLEYGPVEASDNYNFPNSIDDYNHSDLWRDAAWISANNTSAVMIIGDKAHGDNWYGFQGEHMRHNWVICDLPYPEFFETDPNGKGWQAHDYIPMAIFYDPDDLTAVANGSLESFSPQPYAAKRFDENIFWINGKLLEIASTAYDNINNRLFVTEFNGLNDGMIIIHVFDYDTTLVSVSSEDLKEYKFELNQNFPNPFNPSTTIKYSIPSIVGNGHAHSTTNVTLIIYDILGQEVATLVNKEQSPGRYEVTFDASNLSSGLYFYRISAGNFADVKKMILLK